MNKSQLAAASLAALAIGLLLFNWGLYAAKQAPTETAFNARIIIGIVLVCGSIGINIYGMAKRKKR